MAIAGTALVTLTEGVAAVSIGSVAVPLGIGFVVVGGDYYLYNAFLKKGKAQAYDHWHTKLTEQDYLTTEPDSNYGVDSTNDTIGRFDKKKHGNLDKSKAKFRDNAGSASASGMPDPDDNKEDKFRWNVKNKNDADKISRHEKFGNFYRDPNQKLGNKNIWWPKDQAGHGCFRYKLFRETSEGLESFADANEFGNIIQKHKSDIGKHISKKHLTGIK